MSDVHERLRRLLFVVPYAARHRGVTVEALSRQLGISREELLRDLELLTMVGRPPFQPDDFIDLHVENDQVWVDLDQRFSKPPRLTGAEAAALSAPGTHSATQLQSRRSPRSAASGCSRTTPPAGRWPPRPGPRPPRC